MNKFKYPLQGMVLLIKDRSIQIQLVISFLVLVLSVFLQLQLPDFLWILLMITLVVAFEILNTCIEKLCNLYSKDYNENIKNIKDISSAAVLWVSIIAAVVGIIIFSKYIGG